MTEQIGGRVYIPRALTDRSEELSTVGWLIGRGWDRYVRFLHPSSRAEDPTASLSWQQVAAERGVAADLATARWSDVSGQHPHRSAGGHAYPSEGPNPAVLPEVVAALVTAFPSAEIALAEWTGYGDAAPGRAVPGLEFVEERALGREQFSIWCGGRVLPGDGADPGVGVRANFVWATDGSFIVASDEDLTSTYAGFCEAPIAWPPSLEHCAVDPGARLS